MPIKVHRLRVNPQREKSQRRVKAQTNQRKAPKKAKEKKSKGKKNKDNNKKKSEQTTKNPKTAEEAENIKDKADDVCGKDGDQATKLYRIAISFNRKNIDAWYGLLNCFKENGLTKEALETEAEMKKLFGKDIFTLQTIVSPYGDLEEFSQTDNAFLRYASRASDKEEALLDIYKIGLSISNISKKKRLSIYCTIDENTSILATVSLKPFPRGFRQFKEQAKIDYIE